MSAEHFLAKLKKEGFRITKARRWLIGFFATFDQPISVFGLAEKIEKSRLTANKTTLYRELAFLAEKGFLQELMLPDGQKAYESKTEHHHHMICSNCETIVHVEDEALELQIRQTERWLATQGFASTSHMLEFSGLCSDCK